jgi:hypothetical protein
MLNNTHFSRRLFYLTLVFLCYYGLGTNQVAAQTLKSELTLDSIKYSVELLSGVNEYTIRLYDKPDFYISKSTSELTLDVFRNIILGEHKNRINNLVDYSQDSSAVASRNKSITDLYTEFVSAIDLSAESGQRIGTISLKQDVIIRGMNKPGLTPIQNRGSQKESLQIIKEAKLVRKYVRQQSRSINWLVKRINRLEILKEKKAFKGGLSGFRQAKLDTLSRKLKSYVSEIAHERSQDSMKVLSAQLVFEDGGIKQVMVEGKYLGENGYERRVYSNKFSIGASTRQNFKDFGKIKLYQETNFKPGGYIVFSDVLIGLRQPGLRTNDHSPADQSFVLYPGQTKELFKSHSSKLFSLNIFSDVVGFDDQNPNGLIQLEFSKRINLWTKRTDARIFEFLGVGWLTHMMPRFELSKIEENNRTLELNREKLDANNRPYLSFLELYRYSFTRITSEINILDFQAPSTSVHFNIFVGGALTNIRDSVLNEQDRVSMLTLGQNLKILLNPESKWQYEIGIRTIKLVPSSPLFTPGSLDRNDEYENAKEWMNSFEFLISWNTSPDHQLFGRVRFNHELRAIRNNFSQFQIGYSVFLKSSQLKKK